MEGPNLVPDAQRDSGIWRAISRQKDHLKTTSADLQEAICKFLDDFHTFLDKKPLWINGSFIAAPKAETESVIGIWTFLRHWICLQQK